MDPERREGVVARVRGDQRQSIEASFQQLEDASRRAAVDMEWPFYTQDAAAREEMVQTWDQTLFQMSRVLHQGDDPQELTRLLQECE